jgi:hypothetical protein
MRSIGWLVIILIGCGPAPKPGGGGGDDGGDDGGGGGPDAASCGAQMTQIGVVNNGDPPDLLVVLDRSGSMSGFPPSFPPIFTSKWDIMKTGLKTVVMAKEANIKFGLMEFPSDDNCGNDTNAEVAIGLSSAAGFNSYYTARGPGGGTPAHLSLQGALTYYNTLPVNPAGRYVLFATDGAPNCGGGDPNIETPTETVDAVKALFQAGIKTFVLGFGFGAFSPPVLNDAAQAGGVPKPGGANKFYEANNQAELDMALAAISGGVIVPTCDFKLQSLPPDPNNVTVTINGVPIPRSSMHTDGWDYYPDAMTITFFGSACTTIKGGAQTDVSFVYGCPGPVIN